MSKDEKPNENRRKAIKTLTLGAAASALAFPTPAIWAGDQKKYKWKMVTTWPKNFPGLGTGANELAEMIEVLSNKQIEVKVYGAGEIVPALGTFDAVSRGTVEMGHGAAYYWKGKHEATQFFSAVPFGLNAEEMNAWLHFGGAQKLWDSLYSDFNLVPFNAGNTGVQMGGWFNKEINKTEDFKGLKMRMPGLGGEVLRRLGSTVVTLPGGEIFQALKTGAIDATEWIGPYNDMAFGLHKAAKYYYWPGWHEPGSMLECIVNKKVYRELPKHLQKVIELACLTTSHLMLSEFTARNASSLKVLVSKHKVKLVKFPDEVLKKIGEASKEVVSEVAKKDPLSKKVFESFDEFRKTSIGWNRISEEGYSLARALTFK